MGCFLGEVSLCGIFFSFFSCLGGFLEKLLRKLVQFLFIAKFWFLLFSPRFLKCL